MEGREERRKCLRKRGEERRKGLRKGGEDLTTGITGRDIE
jgi:hypothetical protein